MRGLSGLEGKVALITGASKGIGAAAAIRLAEEGTSIAINYNSDTSGAEIVASAAARLNIPHLTVQADVRDPAAVTNMVARTVEELGPIDFLINNAGVVGHSPLVDLEETEWDWMFQVNIYGMYRVTRAVLPGMLERKNGVIINVTSELAFIGEPNLTHYVATKTAIIGFTKSLARELAPHIRVNAVAPGPVDTQMLTDDDRSDEYLRTRLPLQRLGLPEDIAGSFAFLCSEDASWYTGQIISPNGGAVI